MMLGLETGISDTSPRPIAASVQTSGAMIQAVGSIRSGGSGGRYLTVNATINGDLSAGQKANLAAWFESMVEDKLVEALGEPA
jgi:hypothetical protein